MNKTLIVDGLQCGWCLSIKGTHQRMTAHTAEGETERGHQSKLPNAVGLNDLAK